MEFEIFLKIRIRIYYLHQNGYYPYLYQNEYYSYSYPSKVDTDTDIYIFVFVNRYFQMQIQIWTWSFQITTPKQEVGVALLFTTNICGTHSIYNQKNINFIKYK